MFLNREVDPPDTCLDSLKKGAGTQKEERTAASAEGGSGVQKRHSLTEE